MSPSFRTSLEYVAGILATAGIAALALWLKNYYLQGVDGVVELTAFLIIMVGYGAAIIALSALGYRIRANLKYLGGMIGLTGLGTITWYSEVYIAPQLGVFLGFVTTYISAMFVVFYILGRYGG